MKIAIPKEIAAGEPRVAAVPDTVKKLKALGADVVIEPGAGVQSGVPDAEYEAAGAMISADAVRDADIVLKVRRPERANSRNTSAVRSRSRSWILMATMPP
jgi:NAD(P) transhydrogenase subunit alpha